MERAGISECGRRKMSRCLSHRRMVAVVATRYYNFKLQNASPSSLYKAREVLTGSFVPVIALQPVGQLTLRLGTTEENSLFHCGIQRNLTECFTETHG